MEPGPGTYQRILRLRAIRDYGPEPVTEDELVAVLEAGRWTGTSKNRQSWSVVIVREEEQRKRLASCGDFTDPIRRAPVTLALVVEPGGHDFDVGRVAQNLMLAAGALGLASCPITLHRSEDAGSVLGLSDGRRVRYAIALGHPAAGAGPRRLGGRKPVSDFIHLEHYSPNQSPG
jgi:nitroreductase